MTKNVELIGEYITLIIRNSDVSKLGNGDILPIDVPGVYNIQLGIDSEFYLYKWEEEKGWIKIKPTAVALLLPNIAIWLEAYDRMELIKTLHRWSPGFVSEVNHKAAEENTGFNYRFLILECDLRLLRSIVKALIEKS